MAERANSCCHRSLSERRAHRESRAGRRPAGRKSCCSRTWRCCCEGPRGCGREADRKKKASQAPARACRGGGADNRCTAIKRSRRCFSKKGANANRTAAPHPTGERPQRCAVHCTERSCADFCTLEKPRSPEDVRATLARLKTWTPTPPLFRKTRSTHQRTEGISGSGFDGGASSACVRRWGCSRMARTRRGLRGTGSSTRSCTR